MHPWLPVVEIKLTTAVTGRALARTYYNITDKPPCLNFARPRSSDDYTSYQYMWCAIYTYMELNRILHPGVRKDLRMLRTQVSTDFTKHHVAISTGPRKPGYSTSDLYVSFTGN